jgi:putative Mg2+ transporter-C (MgtC) family protein
MQINWTDTVSLLLAIVFGGFIGAEREYRGKPAGLRTNTLICLGSCIFTIISASIGSSEPARISAQIVTGIGFLGAGAIIHSGIGIQGLTTAAVIWLVASIGMACGAKMYTLAAVSTLLTLAILLVLPWLEKQIGKTNRQENHQT